MSYNIDTFHDFGNLPFAEDDTNKENRGKFATIGATGQLTVTAAGEQAQGVMRIGTTEGFAPALTMGGFPYVLASEDLSFGDQVAVGADGGAAVATTGNAIMGVVVQEGAEGSYDARIKLYDGNATVA